MLLWLALACEPAPDDVAPVRVGPCQPGGEPTLDLAHGDDPWNVDPVALLVGIPPQGGSPYTRVPLRARDLDLADGGSVIIEISGRDGGEYLGGITLRSGWVCANAGDDADHWVTTEFHARFDGFSVGQLAGQAVFIDAYVTDADRVASWHGEGFLTD